MTGESVLVALGGVIAAILGSYVIVRHSDYERQLVDERWRGGIETKVDAMWKVLFRAATFDGLVGGILQTKSPIHVNLDAFKTHPELVKKLKDFYETTGKNLKDLELFVELENRFSADFSQFERQHGLRAVASVAAACYLLRPEMSIFDHRNFEITKSAYADEPPEQGKEG